MRVVSPGRSVSRFVRRVAGAALWCAAALSCGAGCGDPACEDRDEDGYGTACEAGPDCDDTNPLRNTDCDAVPPPDCDANPTDAGCPCAGLARPRCYAGPEGTDGVGVCEAGRRQCVRGYYGLCRGEVLPLAETCNDVDDDCDGRPDDGVRSPCGGCDESCVGEVWGGPSAPFGGEDLAELDVTTRGALTLERERLPPPASVWMPDTAAGTVTRYRVSPAEALASYVVGPAPSRVAVDYENAAWVASGDGDAAPRLVRVAGAMERCVDGNDDGVVTSTDPAAPLPEGTDECVLARYELGQAGEVITAVAVEGASLGNAAGHVWVALARTDALDGGGGGAGVASARLLRVDGATGEVLAEAEALPAVPHAAAFDAWGILWLVSKDGYVMRVDRRADPPAVTAYEVPLACFLLHDVAVDELGLLWMTGGSCNTLVRFDPESGAFRSAPTFEAPRGITVSGGTPWMSHAGGYVSAATVGMDGAEDPRVGEPMDLASASLVPYDLSALTVDGEGRVWTLAGGVGEDASAGRVVRASTEDATVLASFDVGAGAEALGDVSGAARRGGFVGPGVAAHVFRGCAAGDGDAGGAGQGAGAATRWRRLHVRADYGAAGSVTVAIRRAETEAQLSGVAFEALGTLPGAEVPFELGAGGRAVAAGGVLEVQLTLASEARDGPPRVREVGLEWDCGM